MHLVRPKLRSGTGCVVDAQPGRFEGEGVVKRLPPHHALALVAAAPTPELAARLIAAGAPVEVRDGEFGVNLLHFAAARGQEAGVVSALAQGRRVDVVRKRGNPASG